MIIPDKKKAITVILSKMSPEGKSHEQEVKPEYNTDERMEVLHGIAEDLMHALKINSAHAIVQAMKAFFDAFESEPHYEFGEEEEHEEQE